MKIRFSEILTYLKCRKKHKYVFVDELEPMVYNDRMLVGQWGHTGIREIVRGKTKDEALQAIVSDMLHDVGDKAKTDQYMDMAHLALSCATEASKRLLKRFKPVMVEEGMQQELTIPELNITVLLTGTPDLICEEIGQGHLWLIDHKFRNAFRPTSAELLNLQMCHYTRMLKETKGIKVVGSKQFQIKPIFPKTPVVTAKGLISRKPILTDWETYSAAVIANGEDPKNYLDMRDKLSDKSFYDMDSATAIRTDDEIETVWQTEILPVVKECVIARTTGGDRAYRCWDFSSCNYCDYREYCVADLKGEDLEYLRKTKFKRKGEQLKLLEIDIDS